MKLPCFKELRAVYGYLQNCETSINRESFYTKKFHNNCDYLKADTLIYSAFSASGFFMSVYHFYVILELVSVTLAVVDNTYLKILTGCHFQMFIYNDTKSLNPLWGYSCPNVSFHLHD